MYVKPDEKLWSGRVDSEDGEFGKRWHEKIEFLPYPYKNESGITFLSFACDEGVKRNKGKIGSAQGGDELKKAMGNFAYHLKNSRLYDSGKISATTNLEESQAYLASHVSELLKNNHFPIIFGGGHEVAYASFLALFNTLKHNKKIAIINFDAHFDLRENEIATSGTPFNQIANLCQKNNAEFNYMCLGISKASNTKALFARAKELDVKYILDSKMTHPNLKEIKRKLGDFLRQKEYIYITIDVDVFCAHLVPAVSAMSSRGIEINLTVNILEYLFSKYTKKIKLIDIAEFNPKYDIFDIGKKSVSRLIYDIVELIGK